MTKNNKEKNLPTIFIISSSFPYLTIDLSGNFIWKKSNLLKNRGFPIIVLCPHKEGLPFYEEREGVKIYRFPYVFPFNAQKLTPKGGMIQAIKSSPLIAMELIPYLLSNIMFSFWIMLKYKPDIIHSHWIIPNGIVGFCIQIFFHVPHISSIHGTDINISCHHLVFSRIVKIISRKISKITTNSSFTRDVITRLLPYRKDITIIPMGINCEPVVIYNRSSNTNITTILFVGRLIDWKGVDVLINSMKIVTQTLQNIQLIIVGDGPEKENLISLTKRSNLESIITFTGQVSDRQLQEYFSQASVFVLPSITINGQTEGLGVVLLEAMATGIPVIGSNTGGIPDIIQNGVNGFLVPPNNPEALADALLKIIQIPDLAFQFRELGFKTINERFSWNHITDQYITEYRKILKDSFYD